MDLVFAERLSLHAVRQVPFRELRRRPRREALPRDFLGGTQGVAGGISFSARIFIPSKIFSENNPGVFSLPFVDSSCLHLLEFAVVVFADGCRLLSEGFGAHQVTVTAFLLDRFCADFQGTLEC